MAEAGVKYYGRFIEEVHEWEETPQWLRWLGYKPFRQHTSLMGDPCGPGGSWHYAAARPDASQL